MTFIRTYWRWAAMAALVAWAALSLWLILIQVFLAAWDPMGHWQRPGISKVTVTLVCRDTEGKLTGAVLAKEGENDRVLQMLKTEAAQLDADDEVWILAHYRADGNRPSHFRLTASRVLVEYPEPLMVLALWGFWRLRRQQKAKEKAEAEAPRPNRKVWKDEFHARAQRFSKPEPPQGE